MWGITLVVALVLVLCNSVAGIVSLGLVEVLALSRPSRTVSLAGVWIVTLSLLSLTGLLE